MTRKRFIKLLMAYGYSRNAAHAYAWYIQSTGMPYAEAYDEMRPGLELFRAVIFVQRAMPRIVAALMTIIDNFADSFEQFAGKVVSAFEQSDISFAGRTRRHRRFQDERFHP